MVPGTAFLHACRYLDSRGAPTPHLRTPHAGAARTYPHPACTQKVPGNKVFRICQAGALDSGNKIAASAHGMGSGGLAVDAMAIGCLGVERRVERFFSYLAIFRWSSRSAAGFRSKVNPGSPMGQPWVPDFWGATVGSRTKIVNRGSPRPVFSFACAGQPDQIVNL